MNQWQSVIELQWFRERLDFKHIVEKMKLKCLNCITKTNNIILQTPYALCMHA